MRDRELRDTVPTPEGAEPPEHTRIPRLSTGAAMSLALYGEDPDWVSAEERLGAERNLSWVPEPEESNAQTRDVATTEPPPSVSLPPSRVRQTPWRGTPAVQVGERKGA